MSTIKFKGPRHDATLNLNVVTSGASATEIDVGRGLDRSVTNANILDLPPDIDMSKLAADLARMVAASQLGTRGLRSDQVAELRAAETAARHGDGSAVVKYLRSAGASVLEVAKKISADVAAAAIKASLGLK